MARKFRRRGFGAPDLLILTVIAAIIATMAFRGITRARETARRLRCSQQLRDLGAALNQYEINVRFYPGYRNVLLMTNGTSYSDPLSGHGGVSWIVPILPYLDYAQIYEMIRTPADEGNDPNGKPIKTAKDAMVPIEYLWCPNSPPTALGLGMTPLSCVVNTGCIDAEGAPGGDGKVGMPRDWPANGVFFDRFTGIHVAAGKPDGKVDEKEKPKSYPIVSMSTSWISSRDGVAHTLLLSENLDHGQWTDVFEQPLGMIWDINAKVEGKAELRPGADPPHAVPTVASYRINASRGKGAGRYPGKAFPADAKYDYSRPSSAHLGGVNVVYCDGTPGFLSQGLDYFVYCLLMSPDSKNVKTPGKSEKLDRNPFAAPFDEAWLELP